MVNRRLLVIEDDPDLAAVVTEVASAQGYHVECACNMRDALRAIDEDEPELVLLDWFIPDGDGEELARVMRDRGVPFVITSGGEGTTERARRVGAVAALDKPFDLDALLQLLREFLGPEQPPAYS